MPKLGGLSLAFETSYNDNISKTSALLIQNLIISVHATVIGMIPALTRVTVL